MKNIMLNIGILAGLLLQQGCQGTKINQKDTTTVCLDGGQCVEVGGTSSTIVPSQTLPFITTLSELKSNWKSMTGVDYYPKEFARVVLDITDINDTALNIMESNIEYNSTKVLVLPYRYEEGMSYKELHYTSCTDPYIFIGSIKYSGYTQKYPLHTVDKEAMLFLTYDELKNDIGLLDGNDAFTDNLCTYHEKLQSLYAYDGTFEIEVSNTIQYEQTSLNGL